MPPGQLDPDLGCIPIMMFHLLRNGSVVT
jgi:hypothetical protein